MDALSAVAQPRLRETLLYVRSQTCAVTADDVAERFHIHRNVARGRLERLSHAGLLTTRFQRRTGRSGPGAGRPAKLYAVPPELTPLEFPRRHYEQLLGHLLDKVPTGGPCCLLERSGLEFGRELAAVSRVQPGCGLVAAAERTCEALGALGFQAALVEAADDRVAIETPTCPLRPLVASNPRAAAIDRGTWIGLTEAFLADRGDASIVCETAGCLDDHVSCRVVLSLAQPAEVGR